MGALISRPDRPGEAGQVLGRREAARPQALAHEQRRVAAAGERGPRRAEAVLPPAVGQADDGDARPPRPRRRAPRGRARRGAARQRRRARAERRARRSRAGGSRRGRPRPPGRRGEAAPASSRRARRRARSRSSRGRRRRTGRAPGPGAGSPPTSTATSHGAARRRSARSGSSSSAGRRGDEHEVDVLLGREPRGVRSGRVAREHGRPRDDAACRERLGSAPSGSRRRPRARRDRPRRRATITSRGWLPGERLREREQRFERPRRRSHATRIERSGAVACASSSAGSWRRIARSSSCSAGLGSIPSSSTSARRAVR